MLSHSGGGDGDLSPVAAATRHRRTGSAACLADMPRGVNRWTRERLQREHDLSNIPGMSPNTPPEEMPDRPRGPAPPDIGPVCFAAVPVAHVQPTATREPLPVPSLATGELSPRCAV